MVVRKVPSSGAPRPLSAVEFPQLESFFSDYLHEDYLVDYGSPEAALRAWRSNASPKEIERFDREAERLLEAAGSMPFDSIAAFVRRNLGSSWRPYDKTRLQRLFTPPSPRRALR